MRCAVDDCGRTRTHLAWCQTHYQRWHRCGDPLGVQGSTFTFATCGEEFRAAAINARY